MIMRLAGFGTVNAVAEKECVHIDEMNLRTFRYAGNNQVIVGGQNAQPIWPRGKADTLNITDAVGWIINGCEK